MIVIIDNYDSFTYNLVQYFGEFTHRITVFRNDKITVREIEKIAPDQIVISPGPGKPSGAGISKKVIAHFTGRVPILGVCLGHQCIGEVFGATVVHAKQLMHGKVSKIYHKQTGIFRGIDSPFEATRYHSLVIDAETVHFPLKIIARTQDGVCMGLRHKSEKVFGVQFHPESILTPYGKMILKNFLSL